MARRARSRAGLFACGAKSRLPAFARACYGRRLLADGLVVAVGGRVRTRHGEVYRSALVICASVCVSVARMQPGGRESGDNQHNTRGN